MAVYTIHECQRCENGIVEFDSRDIQEIKEKGKTELFCLVCGKKFILKLEEK